MSDIPDPEWDPILDRIRSLRFPPDEVLDPFLARRLDAILDRRRRPTSLVLALIAEHTGTSAHWLATGIPHNACTQDSPVVHCQHWEEGEGPCCTCGKTGGQGASTDPRTERDR